MAGFVKSLLHKLLMGTQNAEPSGTSEDAQHSAIPPRSERGLDGEAAREERNRCRSCDASCDSVSRYLFEAEMAFTAFADKA